MTAALQITHAMLDRELIRRRGFGEFIRRAWPQVDTSSLAWNWHIDAIAEHLEAVRRREIRDLVINEPPGCSKSTIVSVLWPSYVWTIDPEHRWIAASYDSDLALRDSRKHRTLVSGDWYQARWPEIEIPSDRTSSTSVSMWFTTRGGVRTSVTVRGGLTGKHGDTAIVDDPIDPLGASSSSGKELDEVLEWYNGTLPTRFRDPQRAARVLVMQRIHQRDLSAEMIRQGATVLCLPMRFESGHPHRWARDPRTVDGELLDARRFPEESVQRIETALGPMRAAAQLQQRPVPAGGGVFKEEWFRFWTELPPGGTFSLSVDCAFKDSKTSSFVVVQAWYQHAPNFYLVDQWREHADVTRTIAMVKAAAMKYPRAHRKLIEDKANGPAVISTLRGVLPGLEEVTPLGGKEARAHACSPLASAGNVFVPHPQNARYDDGRRGAPWVTTSPPGDPTPGGFLGEVTTFPAAATDDQTDTMTQYLNASATSFAERLKAAMRNM